MRELGLVLAVLVGAGGCGSENSSVSVNNMNPLGTVGGVVVDAATEKPLAGAKVSLVSGGVTLTATSNGDGLYSVAKVPAGSFTLSIAQTGYQTALVDDTLDGAVGNFPVANPSHTVKQVGLVANTGSFTVNLVDDTGSPVPMIALTATTNVREVMYSDGQPTGVGSYAVSATTGPDGTATFMALPAYASLSGLVDDSVTVGVPPIATMGSYTFLGLLVTYHLNALSVNGKTGFVQTINIAGPSTALTIVDSSLQYLKGKSGPNATTAFGAGTGPIVPVAGPITIAFNQAINAGALRALLLDESAVPTSITLKPTVTTNLVSLVPSASLSPATRYNLVLHAVAATSPGPSSMNSELDVTAPFFTPPNASGVKPVGNAQLVSTSTAQLVQFTLSEPIGVGFGSTAAIDCAAFYEVPSSPGFNNMAGVVYQGDWKSVSGVSAPPQNVVCHVPLGAPSGPSLDVTQIGSLETTNNNATLVTGFSDRWQVQVDTLPASSTGGPCENNVACAKIGSGTTIHLVFSRQSGQTVKRVDGTPVGDDIAIPIM